MTLARSVVDTRDHQGVRRLRRSAPHALIRTVGDTEPLRRVARRRCCGARRRPAQRRDRPPLRRAGNARGHGAPGRRAPGIHPRRAGRRAPDLCEGCDRPHRGIRRRGLRVRRPSGQWPDPRLRPGVAVVRHVPPRRRHPRRTGSVDHLPRRRRTLGVAHLAGAVAAAVVSGDPPVPGTGRVPRLGRRRQRIVGGDPWEFVLVATGRADPVTIGLDPAVNIYR